MNDKTSLIQPEKIEQIILLIRGKTGLPFRLWFA